MSSRETLLAGVLAFPLAAVIWLGAGEERQADPAAAGRSVAAAVERLGSPDRATRAAAERELLERGPSILDLLPAAEEVADPAARAAVERLRKRLEEAAAEEALRPTLLSMHGEGPIGSIALRNFTTGRPGYRLSLSPAQSRRDVAVTLLNRPFWEVIDEVAAQIGAWPAGFDAGDGLTLRDRTPEDDAKRLAYPGAFRLAAGPVAVRPVAGDEGRRLVRVPLELRAEPKLRPLFVSYAAAGLKLVAPDGAVLPPFTPGAKYDLPFGERGDAADLRLDFLAPAGGVAGPLTLAGTLSVTAAAGEEHFWFDLDDPARTPARQSHGGVTVDLREAKRNPDGTAEVELAVVYDRGGPAFESHRTWVYHNLAYVEYEATRGGRETAFRIDREPGFETVAQSDGGVALRYRFAGIPPDAKPVRFVYKAPTKVVTAPVGVEIGGLTVRPPTGATTEGE